MAIGKKKHSKKHSIKTPLNRFLYDPDTCCDTHSLRFMLPLKYSVSLKLVVDKPESGISSTLKLPVSS